MATPNSLQQRIRRQQELAAELKENTAAIEAEMAGMAKGMEEQYSAMLHPERAGELLKKTMQNPHRAAMRRAVQRLAPKAAPQAQAPPVQAQQPPPGMSAAQCPKCGRPIRPGKAFCAGCGTPIAAAPPMQQTGYPPQPAPAQPYVYHAGQPQQAGYPMAPHLGQGATMPCPKCGAQQRVGAKFCNKCGNLMQ